MGVPAQQLHPVLREMQNRAMPIVRRIPRNYYTDEQFHQGHVMHATGVVPLMVTHYATDRPIEMLAVESINAISAGIFSRSLRSCGPR